MPSGSELAKETQRAMRKVMTRATRSKKNARAFLIHAGILAKNGKRLAKPYR